MNPYINILDSHWDVGGFLYRLRYRNFDETKGYELLTVLKEIDFSGKKMISKRMVELLWMIPIFLEWRIQDYRDAKLLDDDGFIRLQKIVGYISTEIERILNGP
jgi:hypothetical protein